MTLLPIIQRELLVRARSRESRRLRLGVALMGALTWLPLWVFPSSLGTPSTVGRQIFNGLVVAAFILCCASCLLTADAVGSEQREGTLGLLFLARVKAPDVLLGKLGANGLDALCALAALLPLLMVPVLLGGVTGGEASRKGLALINALGFALAAGLYQSASHRKQFRAAAGAVILVLVVVLLPEIPVLGFGRRAFWHSLSPLTTMIYADDLSYRASRSDYWVSFAAVQAMAWLLLASASLRLRRAVGDTGSGEMTSARVVRRDRRCSAPPIPANKNPVEWLVCRQPGLRAAVWTAALATVISQASGFLLFRIPFGSGFGPFVGIFWGLAWGVVQLLCWAPFAWAASRYFVEARRTGELEVLLTTPVGAEQVVAGQWRALKRLLFAPLLLIALTTVVQFSLLAHPQWRGGRGQMDASLLLFMLSLSIQNIVQMALCLAALCWLGLWFGLKSSGQAGAIARTLVVGQAIPYAIRMFGVPLMWPFRLFVFGSSGLVPMAYFLVPWLPELLVLLYFVFMIRWARRRLRREFSRVEPGRFPPARRPAAGSAGFLAREQAPQLETSMKDMIFSRKERKEHKESSDPSSVRSLRSLR
jgi:hypothetical protein